MKKIRMAAMVLLVIIALGACTEVPVKEVKKCAKVVDVKIFKKYTLGFIPQINSYLFQNVWAYKVLDNGKRVEINPVDYYHRGTNNWLETAKEVEIGDGHCWLEYERIK